MFTAKGLQVGKLVFGLRDLVSQCAISKTRK